MSVESSDIELNTIDECSENNVLLRAQTDNTISAVGIYDRLRRRRMFYAQFFFSLLIIVWSTILISFVDNCDKEAALFGILGTTIGYWFPNPKP